MSDWLDELPADQTAMGEVKAMIQQWKALRAKLVAAETAYACAQAVYDNFVKNVAVAKLRQNGLESLKLEDGTLLTVVQQTKCSVKKDDVSKKQVAKWLQEVGAPALVQSQLIVMESNEEQLKKLGIPFDKEVSMNTNSIKAFVLGEMAVNHMTAADLPKGLSWYQWDDIKVQS